MFYPGTRYTQQKPLNSVLNTILYLPCWLEGKNNVEIFATQQSALIEFRKLN